MESTINQVKEILFAAFEQEYEGLTKQMIKQQHKTEVLGVENGLLATELNDRNEKYQKLENEHGKLKIKYDELWHCVAKFNSQMTPIIGVGISDKFNKIGAIVSAPPAAVQPMKLDVSDDDDDDEMMDDDNVGDDDVDDDDDYSCQSDDDLKTKRNGNLPIKEEEGLTGLTFAAERDNDGKVSSQNEPMKPNRSDGDATPFPCLYPNCKLKYSQLWALNCHIKTHRKTTDQKLFF